MKRLLILSLIIIPLAALGAYRFNIFWQHRFDTLIERQARIYRLDPDLVWSVIYEETYFRPWMRGEAEEVGLMQVTPVVAREWAGETGLRELARQVEQDPAQVLLVPERNIQIGCWYLEKISKSYPDTSDSLARILAAYNAGPSRAATWNRPDKQSTESDFINRIDFPTTRAYVTNILARYRERKAIRAQVIRAANQDTHTPASHPEQAAMPPIITRR